jgi:hypothetical protein
LGFSLFSLWSSISWSESSLGLSSVEGYFFSSSSNSPFLTAAG